MTTQKQIDANRRNAQKSTGPRTSEGKTRSSRNATKHGVLSTKMVADREDREVYESLLEDFLEEFKPAPGFENLLVQRLANLFWRERRLLESESRAITRAAQGGDFDQIICADAALQAGYPDAPPILPFRNLSFADQLLVGRYQGMLNRHIAETLAQLGAHQDRRMKSIDDEMGPAVDPMGEPTPPVRQRGRRRPH